MRRIERLNQVEYFKELAGLAEEIVKKEEELGESLGDKLTFSKKEYNNGSIILGRVNKWYYLGNIKTGFDVFEDKKSILLFLKQEFDKANSNNVLDPSWKAFWAREVESL